MEKRTLVALGLAAVACATGALDPGPRSTVRVEPRADGSSTVVLTGVVLNASRGANGAPAADARVEIDCTCIQGARAVKTDAEGRFRFEELPPGAYSARFVFGDDDRGYVTRVGPGERAFFLINLDPNAESMRRIIT